MKVLLIAPGPVDHALACAEGLADHAKVVLAAPARLYRDIRPAPDPRIDLRLLDWPRTRSLRNAVLLARLLRLARACRPDVIHVLGNATLWLNAIAPALARIAPLVTTVHDVSVHPGDRETRRLPDWAARLMARRSDHLVVHGEGLKVAAVAHFGMDASRVHVVPHPAITRYARLGPVPATTSPRGVGMLHALMFGRLFAYKGVDDLIRAEALLVDRLPGLTLTLAGRGDNPSLLRGLMGDPARYDIRHGHVADGDVAALFHAADVVVLPYVEASQSGVLTIAASFGKPVIATDVGELGPTVRRHGLGLVVPPHDPAALAEALLTLGRDPVLRGRLALQAADWARGPIRPDQVGARMARLYRDILDMPPGPISVDMAEPGRFS